MNVHILTAIILGTLLAGIYLLVSKENKFSVKMAKINEYYSAKEFSKLFGTELIVFSVSCIPAWIAYAYEIK